MTEKDLIEDAYFFLLALDKKISQEQGMKACDRLRKELKTAEEYEKILRKAQEIIDNSIPPEEWMS